MLTENLAKLKELDPTAYDAYWNGMIRRGSRTADLVWTAVQKAWLQWCLQEAITARGWHQSTSGIECNGYNWQTYIHINDKDLIRSEWHDTPTASLLAAYIAALEAQG